MTIKFVFRLLAVAIYVFMQPFIAYPADQKAMTFDEIISLAGKKLESVKSIEADFTSTNASLAKQEKVQFRFKNPSMFRLDIPEQPAQPELSLVINGKKIFSHLPKQHLINENTQQSALHPAVIFSFNPQFINFCADKKILRNSLPKDNEYTLDITLNDNDIIPKAVYNKISVSISADKFLITRVETVDVNEMTSICKPLKYYNQEGVPEFPISWKSEVKGDLFYSEFSLSNIVINKNIADDIFNFPADKNALIIESKLKSEDEYKSLLKKNPDDASAYYGYGILLAQKGEHKTAAEQFEKAVELKPQVNMAKLMLAQAYLSAGMKDKMLAIVNDILKEPPITPYTRMQIAGAFQYAGEIPKAIEQLQKIMEAFPKDANAYEQAIFLLRDKPDECKKIIEKFSKSSEKDISSKYTELRFYANLNQTEQAKSIADSLLNNSSLNGWTALQVANIMWNLKDYGRTEKFYQKVIELNPEYINAYSALAQIYGRTVQSSKQKELAEKLIASNKEDYEALNAAASIYDMAGATAEAIKTLEHVIEIAPFYHMTYFNLSQLYRKTNSEDKLKNLVSLLMKNCPADSKTYFTAGAIYEEIKDLDNAKVNYQKAVVLGDIDTFQYQRMLNFYFSNDMKTDAENLAGVIVKASKDAQQIFMAASILRELGKGKEALSAIEKALPYAKTTSDSWMVRFYLAQLSYEQDRKDETLKILRELVAQKDYAPNPDMLRNAQLMLSQINQEIGLNETNIDKYIDDLITRMKQPNLNEQEVLDIKSGLVKSGKSAVPKLLKLINEKEIQVRDISIQVLGDIGDSSAAPELRKLLDDTNPRIVIQTAAALGKIKDTGAVDKLIKLLAEHKESAIRGSSAAALGKIGDKKALEPLIKALDDTDRQILYFVTQSLAELGDKKAIEPLIRVLKTDKGATVKIWTAEALARFGVEDGYKFLATATQSENEPEVRDAILSIVNIPGEKSFEMLKECFKDKNVVVRKYAAFAAHQKTDADVMPLLLEALKDKESLVRYGAAMSLGGIGKKEAIEPLQKAREQEKDDDVIEMIDYSLNILKSIK